MPLDRWQSLLTGRDALRYLVQTAADTVQPLHWHTSHAAHAAHMSSIDCMHPMHRTYISCMHCTHRTHRIHRTYIASVAHISYIAYQAMSYIASIAHSALHHHTIAIPRCVPRKRRRLSGKRASPPRLKATTSRRCAYFLKRVLVGDRRLRCGSGRCGSAGGARTWVTRE